MSADARSRIVEVAARLLRDHGPSAVTTRGVAEAAGVQAPAIYRFFGDKDGLLDAVAEHVMNGFVADKAVVADKAQANDVDPLEDLRAGWDNQIAFGLANPSLFRLLGDPDRVRGSAAAQAGRDVLAARVQRVATAGRLRVSERRAVDLITAAGIGTIQTLLSTPAEERDAGLSSAVYDMVLAQILTTTEDTTTSTDLSVIVTFRALVPDLDALSEAERRLVVEWLDRVLSSGEH